MNRDEIFRDIVDHINSEVFDNDIIKILTLVKPIDENLTIIPCLSFCKPKDGVLCLERYSKAVELSTEYGKCNISIETLQDLSRLDNFDTEILSKCIYTLKKLVIQTALFNINKFGEESYMDTWTDSDFKKKKRSEFITKYLPFLNNWFPKIFKGIYIKEYSYKFDPKLDNMANIQRNIFTTILMHSNMLAMSSRIGPGDTIITNFRISSILQDLSGFENNITRTVSKKPSDMPFVVGTINGIEVIVNPLQSYTDNTVLMFKRPTDVSLCNLSTVYNKTATTIQTMYDQLTLEPSLYIRSLFKVDFIGKEEYAKNNYIKIYFNLENII